MTDCRIKHILDQFDTDELEQAMLSGKLCLGIPDEIVELYLKDKEEENAKKKEANSKGTD